MLSLAKGYESCSVDGKTTSISFEVGSERAKAIVQVDLHAINDGNDEIFSAVFKLLFGDYKKFTEVFDEWKERLKWAWTCSAQYAYGSGE